MAVAAVVAASTADCFSLSKILIQILLSRLSHTRAPDVLSAIGAYQIHTGHALAKKGRTHTGFTILLDMERFAGGVDQHREAAAHTGARAVREIQIQAVALHTPDAGIRVRILLPILRLMVEIDASGVVRVAVAPAELNVPVLAGPICVSQPPVCGR